MTAITTTEMTLLQMRWIDQLSVLLREVTAANEAMTADLRRQSDAAWVLRPPSAIVPLERLVKLQTSARRKVLNLSAAPEPGELRSATKIIGFQRFRYR